MGLKMEPRTTETTAAIARQIHHMRSMVTGPDPFEDEQEVPGGARLTDAEQDFLGKVEQYLIDQQMEIDQLKAERETYLAPADPTANKACPYCGCFSLEGEPGNGVCGNCHASGPDEHNANGFEGDWNTRAVPPGAALAEQLRRLVLACEKSRGRVAEVHAAKALLEQYDAVAASGPAPEPRIDANEGFELRAVGYSIAKRGR